MAKAIEVNEKDRNQQYMTFMLQFQEFSPRYIVRIVWEILHSTAVIKALDLT
jgi:hypothetical protein